MILKEIVEFLSWKQTSYEGKTYNKITFISKDGVPISDISYTGDLSKLQTLKSRTRITAVIDISQNRFGTKLVVTDILSTV